MSLIPSKRVDRIFPVIAPFCLLLAAQISDMNAAAWRPVGAARRLYLWTVAPLVLAILFTGAYTSWKIVAGYRDHRDRLAVFGRNVRREAESHHWRYEVISARDEGLLLYLQKVHFIDPQLAVTEWNNGNLDAVVVSTDKAKMLIPKLAGAVVSEQTRAQQGDYVLVTHQYRQQRVSADVRFSKNG